MSVPIRRCRRAPHVRNDFRWLRYDGLELLIEVGVGTARCPDPQVALRWSDDDGKSWSHEHWQPLGAMGETRTVVTWQRLGRSESRIFEVVITDPVKVVIVDALLQVG